MTTEADAAAWQGLADHAISRGLMTPAERDAGFASDNAPPVDPLRDPQGRFAATPAPPETGDMRAARAMADGLVKLGRLTRSQADRMLAADLKTLDGKDPAEMSPAEIEATSDAEIDAWADGHEAKREASKPDDPLSKAKLDPLWDRPASPSDYRFPRVSSGDVSAGELKAMRDLAWSARLPQPIAQELFGIADTYASKQMTESQVEMLTRQTNVLLERRYGAETEAKVKLGQRLVAEIAKKNPALLSLLRTGVGSDPRFVTQVIEHATRVYGGK